MLTRLKAHNAIADHGSRNSIKGKIWCLEVRTRLQFLKMSSVYCRKHRILRSGGLQWAFSGIIGGASCNLDLKGIDTHTFSFRVQSARFSSHRPNL